MSPVIWYRFRSEMRSRWRAWLGLAVLVGLFGGVVLTSAAGARRTATAYDRMLAAARAADVDFTGDLDVPERLGGPPEAEAVGSAARFFANPVDAAGRMDLESGQPVAPVDTRYATVVERPNVLAGRLPHPDREHEAFASRDFARRYHLDAGDSVTIRIFTDEDDFQGVDFSRLEPWRGTQFPLTVVGIGVFPPDVVPTHETEFATGLVLTPAFFNTYAHAAVAITHHVRLSEGADVGALLRRADELTVTDPDSGFAIEPQGPLHDRVDRAIRPQSQALALFALLAGLAGLAVLGQAIARQLALDATEAPTLRSMGMSPTQLFTVAMLRVGGLAIAGGVLALGLAIATSGLMPIGPARLAEPSPGLDVNVAVLSAGLAILVVLLLARAALPAWRAASIGTRRLGTADWSRSRPSRLADALAGAGLSVGASAGVRMAVESGHGRTAVPVRSTLATTTVAIAAVAAAVTFSANLDRFVSTPALWGRPWDVTFDGHAGPVVHRPGVERLRAAPEVTAFAAGNVATVTVNGSLVTALGFEPFEGDVFPTLLEGRRPATEGEIALGTKVLRQLHLSVGDEATVEVGEDVHRMRVVGRAVFPSIGGFLTEATGLGTGAAVVPSLLAQFQGGEEEPYSFFALRTRTGRVSADLQQSILGPGGPCPAPCYFRPAQPADIANFDRMRTTPMALAGLLLLLAVGTLAHTLLTSVRRRRRDLALLKTMGFVRTQIFTAIACQATTIVVVSLLIAVPLGVAAGRWGWGLLTEQLGVGTSVVTPLLAVLLAIPGSVVVANLTAAVPARAAVRTRPAAILRSE